MWVGTIDFAKAFDTIHHEAILRALSRCEIDTPYTSLLMKLYSNQSAAVFTDTESDELKIERVSKHRDPSSSLLLDPALHFEMEEDVERKREWESSWEMNRGIASPI